MTFLWYLQGADGVLVADCPGKRPLEINASGKAVHKIKTGRWNIASISILL